MISSGHRTFCLYDYIIKLASWCHSLDRMLAPILSLAFLSAVVLYIITLFQRRFASAAPPTLPLRQTPCGWGWLSLFERLSVKSARKTPGCYFPNNVAVEPSFVALFYYRKHMSMAFRAIFSIFSKMSKSRKCEIKTSHNTFLDSRVHLSPTVTFLKIAMYSRAKQNQRPTARDEWFTWFHVRNYTRDQPHGMDGLCFLRSIISRAKLDQRLTARDWWFMFLEIDHFTCEIRPATNRTGLMVYVSWDRWFHVRN